MTLGRDFIWTLLLFFQGFLSLAVTGTLMLVSQGWVRQLKAVTDRTAVIRVFQKIGLKKNSGILTVMLLGFLPLITGKAMFEMNQMVIGFVFGGVYLLFLTFAAIAGIHLKKDERSAYVNTLQEIEKAYQEESCDYPEEEEELQANEWAVPTIATAHSPREADCFQASAGMQDLYVTNAGANPVKNDAAERNAKDAISISAVFQLRPDGSLESAKDALLIAKVPCEWLNGGMPDAVGNLGTLLHKMSELPVLNPVPKQKEKEQEPAPLEQDFSASISSRSRTIRIGALIKESKNNG